MADICKQLVYKNRILKIFVKQIELYNLFYYLMENYLQYLQFLLVELLRTIFYVF